MKTLAELEAKIAENFKQEQAPPETCPPTYGYVAQRTPDAEEKLVQKIWEELFAPRAAQNFTIFWRRRLGFQRTIPDGMMISCRADFVQNAP